MHCFHPLDAWQLQRVDPATGKSPVVFKAPSVPCRFIQVPCGRCIGCRLEKSRQWAVRCVHEAQLYESNAFVTLTYNDDHLPADGSLSVREMQLFMKRLRKRFGKGIRFMLCGEYGEKLGRPHYHACLFNIEFPDLALWRVHNGERYYVSQILNEIWGKGFCIVGNVTFESAAYVARYVTKKVNGEKADGHYCKVDEETGEILFDVRPEFATMSRRPGLGAAWFERFKTDCYPSDFVVVRGVRCKVPRYYDQLLEREDPALLARIKLEREKTAERYEADNTPERLAVKERIQELRFERLIREMELENV